MVLLEIVELQHETLQGFEHILAHGIPAKRKQIAS
jgi:hypothetical protein